MIREGVDRVKVGVGLFSLFSLFGKKVQSTYFTDHLPL
jgi:hypothetical protein